MKKIILSLLMIIFLTTTVQAKKVKNNFETVIFESGVDIESIAVSIKNMDNGKTVYSLNDKMLMHPASVQKVLTTPVIAETLGEDYEFSTELYSRGKNEFLIKLGADPYLTFRNINAIVKSLPKDVSKEEILSDELYLYRRTENAIIRWTPCDSDNTEPYGIQNL